MPWNWEYKDWPDFTFDQERFADYEREFLQKSGVLYGSLKHVTDADRDTLKVELMSDEAYKTSAIEGELLDRDSLQSSIRRHFGLSTDHRKVKPAEHGIAEMMVDLYTHSQRSLKHEHLFAWHQRLSG